MGVSCSRCCVQDREFMVNEDIEREADLLYTQYGIETLIRRRSNVYSEGTTRISVTGNEYSFLPHESSAGIVLRKHRTPDKTLQNVETKTPKMVGIFTSFGKYVPRKQHEDPAGNFIDCRNVPARNSVGELQALVNWSHSVCQIRFGRCTATGFRVGSKYIMTGLHVVRKINRMFSVNQRGKESYSRNEIPALARPNAFCVFDYFKENLFKDVRQYFFKTTVHFCNEETDTVVIELDQSQYSDPLPPPFQEFGFPDIEGKFTFLGHEGSAMESNIVNLIVDKDCERTREDIRHVKDYSSKFTSEPYELPPHSTLNNEHRLLFHCKFGKGASGSPGISVQEDGRVVVVTMLLCGYPNWYYDHNIDRNLLQQWPKEYCIEQGADMISVGNKMYRENPVLYEDIFNSYDIPVPSIN